MGLTRVGDSFPLAIDSLSGGMNGMSGSDGASGSAGSNGAPGRPGVVRIEVVASPRA